MQFSVNMRQDMDGSCRTRLLGPATCARTPHVFVPSPSLEINGVISSPRPDGPGVQYNRHLKFKAWVEAWVKDEVKDVFRKALDGEMVKAWVKDVQNVC